MSKDETVHTSSTGAQKAGNLERHSLLAPSLRELAEHYGRGSLKYDDHNWRKGMDWSLLFDAMMRHAWEFWHGNDYDAETGSKHIVATAWHALALATFMDEYPELDDRPMAPVKINDPFAIVGEDTDDEPYGRHAMSAKRVRDVVFWNAGYFARLIWQKPEPAMMSSWMSPDPVEVPILQEVTSGE